MVEVPVEEDKDGCPIFWSWRSLEPSDLGVGILGKHSSFNL